MYTNSAIGLTRDTQDKLLRIVTGKRVERKIGNKNYVDEFVNMDMLDRFINNNYNALHSNRLFGNNLLEVKDLLSKLKANA